MGAAKRTLSSCSQFLKKFVCLSPMPATNEKTLQAHTSCWSGPEAGDLISASKTAAKPPEPSCRLFLTLLCSREGWGREGGEEEEEGGGEGRDERGRGGEGRGEGMERNGRERGRNAEGRGGEEEERRGEGRREQGMGGGERGGEAGGDLGQVAHTLVQASRHGIKAFLILVHRSPGWRAKDSVAFEWETTPLG